MDSCYYVITDTLLGPKGAILLFNSCYSRHRAATFFFSDYYSLIYYHRKDIFAEEYNMTLT